MSRAARREAVRPGHGLAAAGAARGGVEEQAHLDEAEAAAAEAEIREAG